MHHTKNEAWKWIVAIVVATVLAACSSDRLTLDARDNDGSTRTTKPGEAIDPQWLYAKWDLDGRRTDRANGKEVFGSDAAKDVFGEGWKFEPNGVLKVDVTGGYESGRWRLDPPNTLVVGLPGLLREDSYTASFRDGFLYLKDAKGRYKVLEKNKFFGF